MFPPPIFGGCMSGVARTNTIRILWLVLTAALLATWAPAALAAGTPRLALLKGVRAPYAAQRARKIEPPWGPRFSDKPGIQTEGDGPPIPTRFRPPRKLSVP